MKVPCCFKLWCWPRVVCRCGAQPLVWRHQPRQAGQSHGSQPCLGAGCGQTALRHWHLQPNLACFSPVNTKKATCTRSLHATWCTCTAASSWPAMVFLLRHGRVNVGALFFSSSCCSVLYNISDNTISLNSIDLQQSHWNTPSLQVIPTFTS